VVIVITDAPDHGGGEFARRRVPAEVFRPSRVLMPEPIATAWGSSPMGM